MLHIALPHCDLCSRLDELWLTTECTTFRGHVTEIGNTALNASSNGFNLDQVTNFSVKIRIDSTSYTDLMDNGAPFRPGMSATVDIMTKYSNDVLCTPIQCVTSRNDSLL